jgi:hypothetical protein
MTEVAIFSLLMMIGVAALIVLFVHALAPGGRFPYATHPRIVSRGAMMFFAIDH